MSHKKQSLRRPLAFILASSICAAISLPAHAGKPLENTPVPPADAKPAPVEGAAADQIAPAAPADVLPPQTPPTPTQNVTINLINRLVQKGVLSKEDAADLIHQAETDAMTARAQATADTTTLVQAAVAQANAAGPQDPVVSPDDMLRVPYIPDMVKKQLRDEIQQQVMAKAREEKWVGPNAVPDWVSRFRVTGDIRIRYENDSFPSGNDNTGAFPNFNAINTASPFDVSGTVFSPQYNVDQNRQRYHTQFGNTPGQSKAI